MISADAGISIANVRSGQFTDEMFCLYDTGANCMVVPHDRKYKGTAIRCTLPGETVVGGQVIQQLSLGEEVVVKVVALQGAAPIMPMTVVIDMAEWKVETTDDIPAQLVAIDKNGKRRPMTRYDALHYLISYDDFVACMNDVYTRVSVLGQVSKGLLMATLVKLQQKRKNALMSVSETGEHLTPSESGSRADEEWEPENSSLEEHQKAYAMKVPKELEDFVLLQDPSNSNRTKVALADRSGNGPEIIKKIMALTDMHVKSLNKFARSGIASQAQGTAIQMGAKTGRGTGFDT
eukprot:3373490-Amphidinium_carterae.1